MNGSRKTLSLCYIAIYSDFVIAVADDRCMIRLFDRQLIVEEHAEHFKSLLRKGG